MNFLPQHVDNGYLKVLIVAEALVAEMSSNFSAILIASACVLNSIPTISLCWTPSFIEEELLHCYYLCTPIRRVSIGSERTARAVEQSDRNHRRMTSLPMHDRTPAARAVRRMAASASPVLGPFLYGSTGMSHEEQRKLLPYSDWMTSKPSGTLHMCVPFVNLRKPGCAGFLAIRAPKIFNPMVEDGHPSTMSPRRDGSRASYPATIKLTPYLRS